MTPEVLREKFNTSLTYAEFMQKAESNKAIFEEVYGYISIPSDIQEKFESLVTQHQGEVNALAIAEDWCGDAVRAFPVLTRLADAVEGLNMRIQLFEAPDNETFVKHWALGDRNPIPIIVFLNKDFEEIGHWIERTKAGQELRAQLLEEHKDLEKREFFRIAGPITYDAFKETHWKDTLIEWGDILSVKQTQTT